MPHRVNDEFRINELSFVEGGCTVIVKYASGKSYSYDKVHYPVRYADSILAKHNDIVEIRIKDQIYWTKQ